MSSKKILSDDLRYLLFSEIDLRFSEPKTRRKAFFILETAIQCFDKKGFDNVTFRMIAREVSLTAPSLRHYFKTLKEIREVALRYIRLIVQKMGVDFLTSSQKPVEMLRLYLEGHYKWATHFRSHFRVWLNFLSTSARTKSDRQLNTKAVAIGTARLVQLLEQGRNERVFCHKDDFEAARVLQTLMLGWFVALNTEEIANEAQLHAAMMQSCFNVVGIEFESIQTVK